MPQNTVAPDEEIDLWRGAPVSVKGCQSGVGLQELRLDYEVGMAGFAQLDFLDYLWKGFGCGGAMGATAAAGRLF